MKSTIVADISTFVAAFFNGFCFMKSKTALKKKGQAPICYSHFIILFNINLKYLVFPKKNLIKK